MNNIQSVTSHQIPLRKNSLPTTTNKYQKRTINSRESNLTKAQKIDHIIATAFQEQTSPLTKDKYLHYLPGNTYVPVQYLKDVLFDCSSEEIDLMFRNYIQKPLKKIQPILICFLTFLLSYFFLSGLKTFLLFELS